MAQLAQACAMGPDQERCRMGCIALWLRGPVASAAPDQEHLNHGAGGDLPVGAQLQQMAALQSGGACLLGWVVFCASTAPQPAMKGGEVIVTPDSCSGS